MDQAEWEKILAYVDCHIHEKIDLCSLAEIAGYSPFYFSRIFAEEMGMPVTGYIRIRKLQYAAVSLLEGRKVLEVAMLYAFDSHEGFTRAFTRLFGSTPSTVRKYLVSYTVPGFAVPTEKRRYLMTESKREDLRYGRHQIIFETVRQSLEEAAEGFCTRVEIMLLSDGRVRIRDNGRGLPLSEDIQADRMVLNKILAGKPVTNAEYSQMGDLVQAGMQTVNSLCESLQVMVYRDGRSFRQDYVRGIAQHELSIHIQTHERGTEIVMKPDSAIFGEGEFSENIIREWIKKQLPGDGRLDILLNREKIKD